MNLDQQLRLQALLDGELSEQEAREVLAWTQRDGDAAALLAELKNTRQALTQSEPHLTLPETRDFFWSKIEREIQRQEQTPIPKGDGSIFVTLRRWLFPATAAIALVVMFTFIHFNAPNTVVQTVTDADTDMPIVETTLASADATTFRDASEGTTLVWFSDDTPAKLKKPTANNTPTL